MKDKNASLPKDVAEGELVEEVVSLALSLAQRLQQHATARAAEFDMALSQAKALMEMQAGKGVAMSTLAARLGYDASNLTGVVDKLEARGLLERRPDREDRRVKNLVLTAEGERLRQAFRRRLLDHTGSFGELSGAQMRELRDLLQMALGVGETRV